MVLFQFCGERKEGNLWERIWKSEFLGRGLAGTAGDANVGDQAVFFPDMDGQLLGRLQRVGDANKGTLLSRRRSRFRPRRRHRE